MGEEKQSYYVVIPMPIFEDKELKPNEKLLYGLISSLINSEGYCYASNKYLSEKINISEVNISKTLKKMEQKGYIAIVYVKDGAIVKSRKIYIDERLSQTITAIIKNDNGAIITNDKDINITIQGINNNKKEIYKEKRFIKPTVEEVKEYCLERKNDIDAEYFINYYKRNGWKVGKVPMQDWKAAIRTWEINQKKFKQYGQAVMEIKDVEIVDFNYLEIEEENI
jgi:DNA-binding PadR family transcriptional regulator